VLGVIAFADLVIATVASVLYVGALMLISGIMQIVHAFQVKKWSGFFYWLLSGVVYGAAGIITFYNPLLAATALTLALSVTLMVAGGHRIWTGIQSRPGTRWGWIIASGVITLLAGIIVALGWPVSSLWALGRF
jgi:uncharacterized membrane protein HdeD (DUF308 family)